MIRNTTRADKFIFRDVVRYGTGGTLLLYITVLTVGSSVVYIPYCTLCNTVRTWTQLCVDWRPHQRVQFSMYYVQRHFDFRVLLFLSFEIRIIIFDLIFCSELLNASHSITAELPQWCNDVVHYYFFASPGSSHSPMFPPKKKNGCSSATHWADQKNQRNFPLPVIAQDIQHASHACAENTVPRRGFDDICFSFRFPFSSHVQLHAHATR